MPFTGKFITFEGGEGSGKSTQLDRLAACIRAQNKEVVCLREPGGTPFGEMMRSILKEPNVSLSHATEALLFATCRAQLCAEVIIPALSRGANVICDRFIDSTIAYQAGGRGLDRTLIESINRLACGSLRPDLTILLDQNPINGLRRSAIRDQGDMDRFDLLNLDFHQKVRTVYQEIALHEPSRFKVIDATRPAAEIEEDIWHECLRRFY